MQIHGVRCFETRWLFRQKFRPISLILTLKQERIYMMVPLGCDNMNMGFFLCLDLMLAKRANNTGREISNEKYTTVENRVHIYSLKHSANEDKRNWIHLVFAVAYLLHSRDLRNYISLSLLCTKLQIPITILNTSWEQGSIDKSSKKKSK